ncbi:hypothetical protein AMTRI_Chr12g242060 [Amborella trichopoda]
MSGPAKCSTYGGWMPKENEILRKAVHCYNGRQWKEIDTFFTYRTEVQCYHRWHKVLNPDLVKGQWSKEGDDMIIELVLQHGAKNWSTIAQALLGWNGKQCRERWHNHLNPAIHKEAWTPHEELALIRAHQQHGNKWVKLAKFLPGRTNNAIKNHWNSSLKKKLASYAGSGLLGQFPGYLLWTQLSHVSHLSLLHGINQPWGMTVSRMELEWIICQNVVKNQFQLGASNLNIVAWLIHLFQPFTMHRS